MLNLARIAAVLALMVLPLAALANVPPPEDEPAQPSSQPTDPNAPVINDAPPVTPADAPTPATPGAPSPTDVAPPEVMQQPAAEVPAASGPSTGLVIGVGAVVVVLVVGGAMWFMRT